MTNIKEVAKLANVSPSTVSRVLSGNAPVKKETKEAVMAAINELNYQPNVVAKALKKGTTNNIALIVPSIENRIFPLIISGVEDTARKNGFTVILCNTDEDVLVEKNYISKLRKRWTDGFIFATASPDSNHIVELKKSGVPVVLVVRDMGDLLDAVIVDNYKIGYDATKYLIKNGHKKIAIATGDESLGIYRYRLDGYIGALQENNIEPDESMILQETNGNSSFYALTKKLLGRGERPDAFFCTSDEKALVVIRAIKDMGLRVPEDISVIGVDNLAISSLIDPALTTISQPLYQMGVMAAKKIISAIKLQSNFEPTMDILPTDLIIRESTR